MQLGIQWFTSGYRLESHQDRIFLSQFSISVYLKKYAQCFFWNDEIKKIVPPPSPPIRCTRLWSCVVWPSSCVSRVLCCQVHTCCSLCSACRRVHTHGRPARVDVAHTKEKHNEREKSTHQTFVPFPKQQQDGQTGQTSLEDGEKERIRKWYICLVVCVSRMSVRYNFICPPDGLEIVCARVCYCECVWMSELVSYWESRWMR